MDKQDKLNILKKHIREIIKEEIQAIFKENAELAQRHPSQKISQQNAIKNILSNKVPQPQPQPIQLPENVNPDTLFKTGNSQINKILANKALGIDPATIPSDNPYGDMGMGMGEYNENIIAEQQQPVSSIPLSDISAGKYNFVNPDAFNNIKTENVPSDVRFIESYATAAPTFSDIAVPQVQPNIPMAPVASANSKCIQRDYRALMARLNQIKK